MNKLNFVNTILPIIIVLLAVVGAIIIAYIMQKRLGSHSDKILAKNGKVQVKLKKNYCTEFEMKFLEALHKALPRDCISFPNVGVSRLVEPKDNLIDYKSVLNKFVDVCVFLRKDMQPILVIDLYQSSPVAQQMKRFDDSINKVLKEVKIPVMHKMIEDEYNIEDLRIELLNAMDNVTVAYLKEKTIAIKK